MAADLRLVWENPRQVAPQRHDLAMLRLLGDFLAGATRSGYVDGARQVASAHQLTPLAAAVVCRRMQSAGLAVEEIRRVV